MSHSSRFVYTTEYSRDREHVVPSRMPIPPVGASVTVRLPLEHSDGSDGDIMTKVSAIVSEVSIDYTESQVVIYLSDVYELS